MIYRQQRRRISSTTSSHSDMTSSNQAIPLHLSDGSISPSGISGVLLPVQNSTSASASALKSKKSELRLYCDLLMQQVHTVKTGATNDLQSSVEDESHLLTATCDTFIKTLDELMDLADAHFNIYGAGGSSLENGTRRVSFDKYFFVFLIVYCSVFYVGT